MVFSIIYLFVEGPKIDSLANILSEQNEQRVNLSG